MQHRVRALLQAGPAEQAFPDAESAAALFDRLRRLNPHVRLERLEGDRVVEMAGLS